MTETSNHVIQDTDTEIAMSYATGDYLREEAMYDRHKRYRLDHRSMLRSQTLRRNPIIKSDQRRQDDFTLFGEYVASELRSIKGDEWTLTVLQKRILDAIYETKMKFLKKGKSYYLHSFCLCLTVFKQHTRLFFYPVPRSGNSTKTYV